MAYQSLSKGRVSLKKQTGLDNPATTGAPDVTLAIAGSAPRLSRQTIESRIIRPDQMAVRGRHGMNALSWTVDTELMAQNLDVIIPALMRSSDWSAAATITQAHLGQITVSGNVITFAGGGSAASPAVAGLKVFDTVVFTAGLAAGDLGKVLRIVSMSNSGTLSITVVEDLTTVAVAANFSAKIKPKLINPAVANLVETYFTMEEYEGDIDASTVYQDVRIGRLSISAQPNAIVTAGLTFTGTGKVVQSATGANAPFFTEMAPANTLPFASRDLALYLGTGDVIDLTSLTIDIDAALSSPAVIGSDYSVDVVPGVMAISLSITALRSDLARFSRFITETKTSLMATFVTPNTDPDEFWHLSVPNFTFGSVDPSSLSRDGGLRTQQINIPPALVGVDDTATGYDTTMIKFSKSNE